MLGYVWEIGGKRKFMSGARGRSWGRVSRADGCDSGEGARDLKLNTGYHIKNKFLCKDSGRF